jgi:glycosyltransferase involved in cell wall biosynthesis
VITRLNMGGPAYHVRLLSDRLDPQRYETVLVHGSLGRGEQSLAGPASAATRYLPSLRPELRTIDDARALGQLVRTVGALRPEIVHTHTAKAGMLGRLAARLAGRPRPLVLHTYHGHVLEGYFGPLRNGAYRTLERLVAEASDCLIGVSGATIDDLVRLGVAPRSKFRVVPIGLDLEPFLHRELGAGARFRQEMGTQPEDVLVTFVGRLVRIKRVDLLLRAVARAREMGVSVRLAVVGDGELRAALERLACELGVAQVVRFAGYRADMVEVAGAGDVAALSSDNEGTPVSLIEAAAAARPGVATAVGGVPDVVTRETGILAERGDVEALARGIGFLASDADARTRMGGRAREHVAERFSAARLVEDIDQLYRGLLESCSSRASRVRRFGAPGACQP